MTRSIKRSMFVLLAAAVFLGGSSAASAVVGFPPAYRGDANSVHAIFDWVSHEVTDWNTSLFEPVFDGYPLDPTTPLAQDDGMDTTVELPNFIDRLSVKHMRIQMGFDGPVDYELLTQAISISAYDPDVTPQWGIIDGGPVDGSGLHEYFIDIDIFPNPDNEVITIFGNSGANIVPGNLLFIEVDTVSVPEPMTMSLLGLSGLALLRRKRK